MNVPLQMNIAGRVMILLSQLGMKDAHSLSVYLGAVRAVVRQREGTGKAVYVGNLEPFLNEQMGMLVNSLQNRRGLLKVPAVGPGVDAAAETAAAGDGTGAAPRRQPKVASGYVPVAKGMEEKRKDDRKPVQ